MKHDPSLIPSWLCRLVLLSTVITVTSQAADPLAAIQQLTLESGKILFVEHSSKTENGVPPHTVVKLLLTPGKDSHINVEICLPLAEKWNNRLIGLGNGGAAGRINSGGLLGYMARGFAVATTDMGTAPDAYSGVGKPDVWKDFGYRATHLMTVTAKQVVAACYGRAPEFSYFNGGSTGGQQAMQEAQRYPEDYDGIIANVPAHCRTPLHAYFLWNEQILKKCPFTPAQEENIIAAGNEYMAAREIPQTAGRLVSDPRCTDKDIEAVIALARKKDPTLTDNHAEALRKLFGGPKHTITGERIFNGIPFGSSFKSAHGHLYLFNWVFGKDKDLMRLDFGKDIDTYTAALGPYLNAENPDLSPFIKRGGKLIIISGSADSCVPYHATLDYYERVAERLGSLNKVAEFMKLYIVPGMSHGPGPGINKLPDMLGLVMTWREKGEAPGKLSAQRIVEGKTELDMPLYPYPEKTSWNKTAGFKPVEGPRGGVDRVSERFSPKAAE